MRGVGCSRTAGGGRVPLPGDFDEAGVVGFADLNTVLAVFGGGCTG